MNDQNGPKTEQEWQVCLTPEQFRVLRQHGTEAPGSSALNAEKREGRFVCVACGQELFLSGDKYESHSGWPSFMRPVDGAVGEARDSSLGVIRTEVHCSNCNGHLGHVFPDGPPPDGLRFCINGAALRFEPA